MDAEFENARPLNLQLWSGDPAVDAAIDAAYAAYCADGFVKRDRNQRVILKVVSLNLYVCYKSDPSRYIRYSRSKAQSWVRRYNASALAAETVAACVDRLTQLGYVTGWKAPRSAKQKDLRQSRMRATEKLIELFNVADVSPLMVSQHQQAETIILKDNNKRLSDYDETDETRKMREELQIINNLLSRTLINLYMSDWDLHGLNHRMATGKVRANDTHMPQEDEDEVGDGLAETPRGAIDFTNKSLRRVFNNGSFSQGGRLYGGFWQGIPNRPKGKDPKSYRKYIRINQMNTVEVDFSAMHINLIYWLQQIDVPDGDLYRLKGYPASTREVVKKAVLTLINADTREQGMKSLRERIQGFKIRYGERQEIPEDDKIVLPSGTTIEDIIDAFEKKHAAISKDWFFSGRGLELQYWDSNLAVAILLKMAAQGVPCLPLHDSFIVPAPEEKRLRAAMSEVFQQMTGRFPKVDAKSSLRMENKARGHKAMAAEYQEKMADGNFSHEFSERFSQYVCSIREWQKVKGRKVSLYSNFSSLSKEVEY